MRRPEPSLKGVRAMNPNRKFASLALVSLASVLAIGGCKSNTQQGAPQQGDTSTAQPNSSSPAPGSDAANPKAPSSAQAGPYSQSAPSRPAAERAPAAIELPAGTSIRVRLDQDLGSKISQ